MTAQNTKLDTSQYTGSSVFIRFGFSQSVMTEGVAYIAHEMKAHWLVQDIDLYVRELAMKGKDTRFIVCHLTKDGDGAIMTFEDGNDNVLKKVKIGYTSFDFSRVDDEKLTVWVQPNEMRNSYTIFLPSEY